MLKNNMIKSIKFNNGHILLTIYPTSRTQLSIFNFYLDEKDYCDAFYDSKGYLELYSLDAVKGFLSCNAKHLSEELSKSILDDAENHFQNPLVTNSINRRLSFFHQTQEKIPLVKLENLVVWRNRFFNPNLRTLNIKNTFNEVFAHLFSCSHRQKTGLFFYEVLIGQVQVISAEDTIGKPWSDFNDFLLMVDNIATYPANNMANLATNPENLGRNWDILNKESFVKPLVDWLQFILASKLNPLDNALLNEADLQRLQKFAFYIFDVLKELKFSNDNQQNIEEPNQLIY